MVFDPDGNPDPHRPARAGAFPDLSRTRPARLNLTMPTLPDLLYVALFAVALPLWDHLIWWPASRRRLQADPVRARKRFWTGAIAGAWPLVAVGAALWIWHGRSWASFGFTVPDGWRLWTASALVLLLAAYFALTVASLARSSEARASVRQQFGALSDILPHTRMEMNLWGGVSLSAGFCEEFLYRGYFIWVFSPWLGWWGAAALSLPFFAIPHIYQGWAASSAPGSSAPSTPSSSQPSVPSGPPSRCMPSSTSARA